MLGNFVMTSTKLAQFLLRPTGTIPYRLVQGLGLVIVHFSILEWKIEQTIWALRKNSRDIGRQYTRRKKFHQRVTALEKELKKHSRRLSPDGREVYATLVKVSKDMALDRNFAVHGLWSKGLQRGSRRKYFVLSYYDNPDGSAREVDVRTLRTMSNNVARVIRLFDESAPRYLGRPLP